MPEPQPWALILGASSGFGEATALALAERGYDICGVHLDRRAGLQHVDEIKSKIAGAGRQALFFNVNAADAEKRGQVLDGLAEGMAGRGTLRVLLHSLAFGTLREFVPKDPKEALTKEQMEMTLDVMAHTLVYWTQDAVYRGLLKEGGRVFAMTSSGGTRVIPSYGAVSAAKAALESHVRQLALELAPRGITANAIRAGVTDTPALRKIPGADWMIDSALRLNPHRRLTTPEDVARAIALLAEPDAAWISGDVVGVDGGEDIAGMMPPLESRS
jgi:NAD(P)-dependent dehydrogenase (short-subunit alcohol dehydrogenase family)